VLPPSKIRQAFRSGGDQCHYASQAVPALDRYHDRRPWPTETGRERPCRGRSGNCRDFRRISPRSRTVEGANRPIMEHPADGAQWCLRCGSDDESTTLRMRASNVPPAGSDCWEIFGAVVATLRRDQWPSRRAFRREKELRRTLTASGAMFRLFEGVLDPSLPSAVRSHASIWAPSVLADARLWESFASDLEFGGESRGVFAYGREWGWLQGTRTGDGGGAGVREGAWSLVGTAVRTRATSDAPPGQIQC
jgi:hypothetical protein